MYQIQENEELEAISKGQLLLKREFNYLDFIRIICTCSSIECWNGNDIYVYSINVPYMVLKNKANQNVKTSMVKGRKMTQERVYTGGEDPA